MNFLRFFTSGVGTFNFNLNTPSIPNSAFTPILQEKKRIESLDTQTFPTNSSGQHLMASNSLEKMLISQQQQLLNKCMQLNLQLLESKANNSEPTEKQEHTSLRKKIKKVSKCEHTDRKHYAKGLCNNCYHRIGRNKKPWKCEHVILYASGMCQNCYINRYNKMRRDQVQKQGSQHQETIDKFFEKEPESDGHKGVQKAQ